MSPSPNPPPQKNFLQKVFDIVSSQKLANVLTSVPWLFNSVVVLTPLAALIIGLIQKQYSNALNTQYVSDEYENKLCNSYTNKVRDRLILEGNKEVQISQVVPVNPPNNDQNQIYKLPFSCSYTFQKAPNNLETVVVYASIELNYVFPDLISEINGDFETPIEWGKICEDPIIKGQIMVIAKSLIQGYYHPEKGDYITEEKPEITPSKKGVYPVFRGGCTFVVKNNKNELNFSDRSRHFVDIDLNPYCLKTAMENGTRNVKFGYHNYKDPYSLYCVNPHAPK